MACVELDAGSASAFHDGGTAQAPDDGGSSSDSEVECTTRACLDASSEDADGAPPSASHPQLPALRTSRAAWDALVAEKGSTYWYDEENCLINSKAGGTVTRVQVQGGQAQIVSTRTIARSECKALVNRFGDFLTPKTLPALYDECAALLDREAERTEFTTDARGVVQTCRYEGDRTCRDNCGEGFAIRAWDLGFAPAQ